jgi:hypothetical protein
MINKIKNLLWRLEGILNDFQLDFMNWLEDQIRKIR